MFLFFEATMTECHRDYTHWTWFKWKMSLVNSTGSKERGLRIWFPKGGLAILLEPLNMEKGIGKSLLF